MGRLDGSAINGKVLLLNLSCGHTRIVEKESVSSVVRGTAVECEKCKCVVRQIVQREWVKRKVREEQ